MSQSHNIFVVRIVERVSLSEKTQTRTCSGHDGSKRGLVEFLALKRRENTPIQVITEGNAVVESLCLPLAIPRHNFIKVVTT
jgi:hypothetical protein